MTSTRTEDDGLTLVLECVLDAPRGLVWRCWTDSELLKQWYCPRPWTVPEADFDLRPGGRMNCVMQGPKGERIELFGCWLEVAAEERLTFTDAFTEGFMPRPNSFMTGFVRLFDHGAGQTRMIWGARHVSEEQVKQHLAMGFEKGWSAAAAQLDGLARQLAAGQPGKAAS
jgi:uncharacterized protein YndB with AHSA1/START domain